MSYSVGQERLKDFIGKVIKKRDGIVLVYDITNRESFENINSWIIEIKKGENNKKILLIGNNCELEDKRQVSYEEGEELAKSNNILFIETSPKNNENVIEAFELLAEELINTVNIEGNKKNINNEKITSSPGNSHLPSKKKNDCIII